MSGAPVLLERPDLSAPIVRDAADFARATGASAGQVADLERLRRMLADWSGRMNLVGPSALADFWPRHAWDSAQLLRLAPAALTWADLGAGAGFPGLVLAILLKGRPRAHVELVESLGKRCRFLQAVAQALGLPVTVRQARAEEVGLEVEVVTARAVAPLTKLLGYARPCLDLGARGLFFKGRSAEAEVAEARTAWRFALTLHPSLSDPHGRVLEITDLARAR
jgi:16S rRNA (guanine527-N7)-methyltransferase